MELALTAARKSGACSGCRGFTLIELMIVLVILGVLAVLAGPGFREAALNTKLKAYSNDMYSTMYFSRGEAIKRNTAVTLCASSDGASCATGGDWEQGWIVQSSAGDVIHSHGQLSPGFKLVDASGSGLREIVFSPTGAANGAVDLKVCREAPEAGGQERRISLAVTGRGRIDRTTDGTCPD